MAIENPTNISRSYVDNYAVKDFTEKTLIPKYYPNTNVSTRSVGMVGFVTEQIATTTEDSFNTSSVLFRETFPNRAQLPESIYSHAAIFQLTNIFSTAAKCKFLIGIEESAIIENMVLDKDSGISYFYIDKNLQIYVENIPFTLDYDIMIQVIKRDVEGGVDYIFTPSYVMDFNNSISVIKDPYIQIRRNMTGQFQIEVTAHQCTREVVYKSIVTNSKINYPYIDIEFDGKLAGFDVFYKTANESDYTTQMEKLLIYSQPITSPFCFYQLVGDNVLRLSFTSKDTYFMPDFNSELKVVLYLTLGEDGEFDEYTGTSIQITPDTEKYDYDSTYLLTVKPFGKCSGASDQLTLENLQARTVAGYRTAEALTTDADLNEFFKNNCYDYGISDKIKMRFFKRRNDVYERLYCCYTIITDDASTYKTNTLNLDLNIHDMVNLETGVYTIEPGTLFTSESIGEASFYRDDVNEAKWREEYLNDVENGNANYVDFSMDPSAIPSYYDRACSFSQWKRRKGYKDTYNVTELTEEELSKLDDPSSGKYLFINPFLIRYTKNPSIITTYMTHISQKSLLDFTNRNDDSFVQFIIEQCEITRAFGNNKMYRIKVNTMPSITINSNEYFPIATDADGNPIFNDKYSVKNNDLRIVFVMYNNGRPVGYTELFPTGYNETHFTFEGFIHTDDHITSDNKMRILSNTIYRNPSNGSYYKQHDDDATICTHYSSDDKIINDNITWDEVNTLYKNNEVEKFTEVINMSGGDDMLIPLSDVTCKIYTLYNKIYNMNSPTGGLTDVIEGNNVFMQYDSSLMNHIWTNEYSTNTYPMTFIKPLDNVRLTFEFKDYTEYNFNTNSYSHDILDAKIYSIPFIKYNIGLDDKSLSYFMERFLETYNSITSIRSTNLRNQTDIDVKFYNTYGHSKNYTIGENNELLNTINIKIKFDIWFVHGTDTYYAKEEVRSFIKSEIEKLNDSGVNNLYISNLMRKIEHTFEYVDHIRFRGINDYSTDYQTVRSNISYVNDISKISKEDRRFYVPEVLTVDLSDITINDYIVE